MGQLTLFIALPTTWLPTHLPRHFPTLKRSISLSHSAYNRLEGGVLEYSRLIKPTAESTAVIIFPYMIYKYVSYLPLIRHWIWHYITIANSRVFSFTITRHALTYLPLHINNNYCYIFLFFLCYLALTN